MRNFVKTIGPQRLVKLLILIVINAALAAAIYYYIMPEQKTSENEYKSVKGEVNRLRNDIDGIDERLEELQANEKEFKRLMARDFVSDQDRLAIRDSIDEMRQRSGVKSLTYNIQPTKEVEHDQAHILDQKLISSQVSISATSLIDLEMLALQAMLNDEFPGHTVFDRISYKRTNEINKANLIKVGNDDVMTFMSGKIDFTWYSLMPKEEDEDNVVQGQLNGGQE